MYLTIIDLVWGYLYLSIIGATKLAVTEIFRCFLIFIAVTVPIYKPCNNAYTLNTSGGA